MKMKSVLLNALTAVVATTVAGTVAAAAPAEFPLELRGIWSALEGSSHECRKSEWEGDRHDAMLSVEQGAVEYWESNCKLSSLRKSDGSSYELVLACSGEGQSWRTREVWRFVDAGTRKLLVSVLLSRFDERDDSGKPLRNPERPRVSVGVYAECK
jgi:hypothetical protein